MTPLDPDAAAQDAVRMLRQLKPIARGEVMRNGLVLTPAHQRAGVATAALDEFHVHAIAMGASGEALAQGRESVRAFVRSDIFRDRP